MIQLAITSFGYLHGPAPEATAVIDLRNHLRDPHVDPAFRQLTGFDLAVHDKVLAAPGAANMRVALAELAAALLHTGSEKLVTIALGCAGGRHRSVVLANDLANVMRVCGWQGELEHRDIDKPVIHRTTK
ncbi:UPF0042 nucleotide-binding protein [Saccharopolyspora erythraea NRRL 2338]|uniref:Uncharacterized P-loop ATPase protein UPF0042 n=2 Tax=Saccharopolyspora erythraea TaxID=1836 RepID=A4FQ54_SACEN|nr:RNase adapter RapZ [Saccharopolyspora erythraea]EQD84389.1 ATPase [Saccharopolyspora erythraea D]PFG99825.1 UPF0042 nucleotide-binding protein [Saccharopolyspora erythraea NRRL 2338]PFG99851.1 UPF0042 nucleotide-binding protein [Saccharopolyspora erythraea NRRL 2338]QRK89696.1 ATPase [Saccharopolyspora erythraea]CAM06179.1 uncharacterized P-loop ATPase protein UPF0042 [Saccharopolyspora erythraea NRRL 2338]